MSLYIGEDIPPAKLQNARQSHRIDIHDSILLLVDLTFFGSAKNSLLFTSSGISYKNDENSYFIGWYELSHVDVIERQIVAYGYGGDHVTWTPGELGLDVNSQDVESALRFIAELMADLIQAWAEEEDDFDDIARALDEAEADEDWDTLIRISKSFDKETEGPKSPRKQVRYLLQVSKAETHLIDQTCDSSNIHNQKRRTLVQAWENELALMKDEYLDLRDRGLWQRGASDILSILGRERRETYHSAMLGWLFDPLAPHGLGMRFFQAFVQDFLFDGCVELETSSVDVRCEEVRDNCRADIVVRTDRFTVVLENKLDAVESEAQCQRLYEAFSRDGNARFVFLSPSGSPPRTAVGASKEAFVHLSYRDLRKCLERVFNDTLDAPQTVGRQSALNYLGTLMKEFA